MKREEAIEIIIEATKGNARKEDFFKLPNEIIGEVLDLYAKGDVKLSFNELKGKILKHNAKSEYIQASIIILRNIFEGVK